MESKKYIDVASHAIGLGNRKPYIRHGKKFYRPYRNYFSTVPGCNDYELWVILESAGYAKSSETPRSGRIFWLTRSGLDWLGIKLGMHIYDEED